MPDIRLLAAPPWERDLFVAGAFERTAYVWSMSRGAELAVLDTVFDFGGRRLCLVTGEAPVVVAGAWGRHGVCGYSLTGELLWQDEARSNVQHVTALSAGRVAVGYAKGPARVLDAATGDELRSLRGVIEVIAVTPERSVLVSGSYVRLADSEFEPTTGRIALPPVAPVVLGAAAGPDLVALATMDHGVWFLDPTGARLATFDGAGGRAGEVAYDATAGHWKVVTHLEQSGEAQVHLVGLGAAVEVLDRTPLPPLHDAVWLDNGRVLVIGNDDGVVAIDPSTGRTDLLIEPT